MRGFDGISTGRAGAGPAAGTSLIAASLCLAAALIAIVVLIGSVPVWMPGGYVAGLAVLCGAAALGLRVERGRSLRAPGLPTDAADRAGLLAAIAAQRERMGRNGLAFSVALLDLDDFNQINDTFGRAVGDRVTGVFADRVGRELNTPGALGRYRGDAFLVLVDGAGGAVSARWAVERILRTIEQYDWSAIAEGLSVTASAGLATCGRRESVIELLSRVDVALQRAKSAGGNRVWVG